MPPAIPVTIALVRRSIPVELHTQPPAGPVAGFVRPSRPGAPNIRPRARIATAPGIFHITRKEYQRIFANALFSRFTLLCI
ncbi:hypothetical protein Tco_0900382 [Tanacetum coccineum]